MAFRAVHAQWGTVFAHLPDLGCERGWGEVWKVKPPAPLTCDECGHTMYAKTSRTGLRFFAHAPGAPSCALALETVAHHLLKLELANAARDVGAHAELEARGPGGTWRADVLATDPGGVWRTALEAQLAPITNADITARTETMRADGVSSIWFSDRRRPPWLGQVPSVRVESADGALVVAEGLAKFHDGQWEAGPQVPIAEFLRWVFAGRVVAHRRKAPVRSPLAARPMLWTAPQYTREEAAHLEAEEVRKQAQREEGRRRLEEARARWDQEQERSRRKDRERAGVRGEHEAAVQALLKRQAALEKPAFYFVHQETGTYPFIPNHGTPAFAMGIPVYLGLKPYGVICPVASRVAAVRDRLAKLVVFVASERERRRIAAQARPGQRIQVLDGGLAALPSPRPPEGQDALPFPDAVDGR